MTAKTAPHNIPADAPGNAAFTSGANSHVQYPASEVKVRDVQTTSGGHEGDATPGNPAPQSGGPGVGASSTPAGLTFAFWGVPYTDLGVNYGRPVAYHVGPQFDPSAAPVSAGVQVCTECDLTLADGFDYADTAGDGNFAHPEVGSYVIFIDMTQRTPSVPNTTQYGWDPFATANAR